MKKSLIALAALASFAGMASAQSSVTLFGVVDVNLAFGQGSGVGSSDKTQLTGGSNASNRIGFRGREDLGGGMSASFWLEAQMTPDDGQGSATNSNNQASGVGAAVAGRQGLMFNRRSTVSLAGGWGEVRLGRDYTPQFWNLNTFSPFGVIGVGSALTHNAIITGVTATRASNSVGYFLPSNLGGFYGQAQYYMGENNQTGAATEDDGTGVGVRLGYANGPLNVAVAVSRTKYAAGDVRQNNIGGQYDFGMAKLQAHLSRDRNGTTDASGYLVGGVIPVGAGEVLVSWSQYKTDPAGAGADPKLSKIAVGYVHNLSKRTAIYGTFARVKNSGGASGSLNGAVTAANSSSNGLDLGVRHNF